MKVKYLQEPTPEWVDPWKNMQWYATWNNGLGEAHIFNYMRDLQQVMRLNGHEWVVVNNGMNRYQFQHVPQEAQAIPDYPPNPQPEPVVDEVFAGRRYRGGQYMGRVEGEQEQPEEALNRYVWRP